MDNHGNPWVVYPGDIPAGGYIALTPEIESDDGAGNLQLVTDRIVYVDQIIWSSYTDANHVCDVRDGSDGDVFFRQGVSDFSDVMLNLSGGVRVQGLRVYQLDSGQLSVFHR